MISSVVFHIKICVFKLSSEVSLCLVALLLLNELVVKVLQTTQESNDTAFVVLLASLLELILLDLEHFKVVAQFVQVLD